VAVKVNGNRAPKVRVSPDHRATLRHLHAAMAPKAKAALKARAKLKVAVLTTGVTAKAVVHATVLALKAEAPTPTAADKVGKTVVARMETSYHATLTP
jgi:hypothetical protein